MNKIVWPAGYVATYRKILLNKDAILNGILLAIDPASFGTSLPGFAIFDGGEIVTSGTIDPPPGRKQDIYQRLPYLYEKTSKLLPVPPAVFVVEEIHKAMASNHLIWAAGVSIAAVNAPVTIELPLNLWKAVAKATPGYIKGDAMDAEMMGWALIHWCREHPSE